MTGFYSVNPYTGENYGKFSFIDDAVLISKIENGRNEYYNYWKFLPINERAKLLGKISQNLKKDISHLSQLITDEMGKPISESVAEIEKVIWLIDYHSKHAEDFLKKKKIKTSYSEAYIHYEPLGGILGIMPWNYPFWQVFRFAIPSLLAGNVIYLKHAPNVPQCALAIENVFCNSLNNNSIYQNLFVDTDKVSMILQHDFIQGVSLTGSENAGSRVGEIAGRNIKKAVFELGGTDAFIICNDADFNKAVDQFLISRMSNNGQICIAAKRLFVQSEIYGKVKSLLKEKILALKKGNPSDLDTQVSCLARNDLKENLLFQLDNLREIGAEFIVDQTQDDKNSCSPLLIELSKSISKNFDQEIFGPVAMLIKFNELSEIPDFVNSSRYGLAASLWSQDIDKAVKIAERIEVGNISINKLVSSDPRIPFGGVKKSGYGREMAEAGMKEFVNAKAIVIN
jgi:succinate-semialdehyde dehydrogenase/glutarate-semialdehyde dehydrogenase